MKTINLTDINKKKQKVKENEANCSNTSKLSNNTHLREKSLIKKSMRGIIKDKKTSILKTNIENKSRTKTSKYIIDQREFKRGTHQTLRHSVNLISMKQSPFFNNENRSPNRSVLNLRNSRPNIKKNGEEQFSNRQSQKTNDFWNLSKDSTPHLDLKKRIYNKKSQEFKEDFNKKRKSKSIYINF